MRTQKPDPYGIDGEQDFAAQGAPDDRARPTRMDAVALQPGRACVQCGYDLTGLFVGGNCPECGDKILSVAPSGASSAFKRMPNWYLRLLGAALGAMVVMFMLGVFLVLNTIFSIFSGTASSLLVEILLSLFALSPFVWIACVLVICIPPPEREPASGLGRSMPELVLAALALLSQSGILLNMAYSVYLGITNQPPQQGWIQAMLAVSVLGVSLVALQLGQIARRFDDDDRARMLTYAAAAIVVGNITFVLLPQPLSLLILGWGYLYFVWSCWSLSREAGWAVRNSIAVAARTQRLKERARANYEQAQAEREAKAPFGGPLP
jgi:hypothetical protein